MKSIWMLALASLTLAMSCGSEETVKNSYDRAPMLQNLSANIIIPSYEGFVSAAAKLNESVETLSADLSAENLSSVKQNWLSASLAWKAAEMFKFGPVLDLSYTTAIDSWPINHKGVETAVEGYTGEDSYLVAVGSDKKGLKAVEYLLYHVEEDSVLQELADANRMAYLRLVTDAMVAQSQEVLTRWQSEYQASFDANTGNDVGSSATLVANQLIFLVEQVKNYKIAFPAGISDQGNLHLEDLESYYAGVSLELIHANLDAIEAVYKGGNGQGFDDYLDALGLDDAGVTPLSEDISNKIAEARTTANGLNGTLQEAIQNDLTGVQALFTDFQELTVLMKTDMMSRLGLTITYSDNDGD